MNAPCKDCGERTMNCHVHCQRYIEYSNNNEKINKNKAEKLAHREVYFDGTMRMKKRRCSNGVTGNRRKKQ